MRKTRRLAWIAVAGCLLLSACGGEDPVSEPTPTATTTPTATVPTTVQEPPTIADPVWASGVDASDGSPVDHLETVDTDTGAVYAVFETSAIAAGTEFTVAWTMNGTPVPGLNPMLRIQTDQAPGWIEFHLDRTSDLPWPEGTLGVTVSTGGEVVASGEIDLRD